MNIFFQTVLIVYLPPLILGLIALYFFGGLVDDFTALISFIIFGVIGISRMKRKIKNTKI